MVEQTAELKIIIMEVKAQNEELKEMFSLPGRVDKVEKELR